MLFIGWLKRSHCLLNLPALLNLAPLLQAVAPLVKRASRAVLITGTPAMSRPIELYSQVPTS